MLLTEQGDDVVMNCAPIVVFTYARPEHTRKMLDALAGNIGSGESRLFIFCDGPKNEKTVEKNREVRRIIEDEKTKKHKKVTIST